MRYTAIYRALIALGLSLDFIGYSAQVFAAGSSPPAVTAWVVNKNGVTGSSPDATLNSLAVQIPANVSSVSSTASKVYIQTSGVPSYPTGPFPGNPAYASNIQAIYGIPLNPQPNLSNTLTEVGLGAIGVFVNGVAIFSYADAFSYQNQGVWHQDANVFEGQSFDTAPGHPAPLRNATTAVSGYLPGEYHHHQSPTSLREELGDDGTHHSPILGFAVDGYPIYGPYGYANPNGSGGLVRIKSSYSLRNMNDRTSLADGTVLPASEDGPSIASVALGSYAEDYVYVKDSGHLDEHNGRFTVTPDYPNGTYAYFTTVDANGKGVFPYFLGPTYYGVVATQSSTAIPDHAAPQAGGSGNGAGALLPHH
ncbi:YHYH protein [Candidatus Methylospira mobilis]|nr:YHYH protein [Candidatus Methylospira mobilis]